MTLHRGLIVAWALTAAPAFAQTPAVVNGTLESRAITQPVGREITSIVSRSSAPAWVGYTVPVNRRQGDDGCWTSGDFGRSRVGPVKLEGADTMFVLYRIGDGAIQRIRVASPECPLDTNGLALHWLTGVRAEDSIEWLATLATSDSSRRLANSATMALALHANPQASDRLIALAKTSKSSDARNRLVLDCSARRR